LIDGDIKIGNVQAGLEMKGEEKEVSTKQVVLARIENIPSSDNGVTTSTKFKRLSWDWKEMK
jgi:predicted oxidoreductase